MQGDITYDLAIVGGGLAGLALSIQLAKDGYQVILFEKEQYPFHRVCGEYISLESWSFLERLGVDLKSMNVSHIKRLRVSAVNGKSFEQELALGGFGVSRYKLDHELAQIAKQSGVIVYEQTRVTDIQFSEDCFNIESSKGNFRARVAAGCHGKRSNLDIKWKRPFVVAKKNKLNNYIGIKYHIRYNFPDDLIALHNFKKGYCGISKVEDDQYCLCYLTTADNLQNSGNDIKKMEQTVLSANPHLKKIFSECKMIRDAPVIISQISFDKKEMVEDHVLMIGDAAGMITPLCGNGMSMALHASKIAAEQIQNFLKGTISRELMEQNYSSEWKKNFENRLLTGRILQRLFTNDGLTALMIRLGRSFPGLIRTLIKRTHGSPF
ncbi:MAG TPA: NAD(P)/FAD-dependent oxidoreductase [Chitinophagaceae bacterium]|nr:NAD(P)/FAD-dependent oxidoreductase [Chitinophagaceae bacterium]